MKLSVALALALMVTALLAVSHYHRHYRSRPVSVSWKHIAAGGAAAGGWICGTAPSEHEEESRFPGDPSSGHAFPAQQHVTGCSWGPTRPSLMAFKKAIQRSCIINRKSSHPPKK